MTTTSTDAFLRAALDEDGAFCAAGRLGRKSASVEAPHPATQSAEYRTDQAKPCWPAKCQETSASVQQHEH